MRIRPFGLLSLVGGAWLLGGAWNARQRPESAIPFYADSTLTPVWTGDTSDLHRIAPFTLIDQHGARADERALDGKVTVVVFFYATCKDLCPRLESKLARVRAQYESDARVQLMSISVASRHDTAPVLAAYAAMNHISAPTWRLLTGDSSEVARVAHAGFFSDAPAVRGIGATHGETIWLLDSSRRIRGLYNGTMPLDTKRLIEDIATLTRGQ